VASAQEKLVVRVSLGAAAATSADLPEPITEQHWHWRRIAGASLTLCAAAVLLYGWLNVESPDAVINPVAETAPAVIAAESIEVPIPELVLEAVPQNPEPEPAPVKALSTETLAADSVKPVAELSDKANAQQPVAAETRLATETPTDVGAALYSAETGVLRLVLLTHETPSAQARNLGAQIDAAAIPQLALYSEVKGLNGQHIEHLWYYEGKLMTRIKLPVKLDYWRTYSRKEFDANQKGEWRVEILDSQQNLLFSHHFHYQ